MSGYTFDARCDIGRWLIFRVHGETRAQGSKRHVGGGRMIEDSNVMQWRELIGHVAGKEAEKRDWEPLEGPVALGVTFYQNAPKSPKWKTEGVPATGRDLDKLVRAVGDALTGILFRDDRQICDLKASKRFGSPGATISVFELLERARPVPRET